MMKGKRERELTTVRSTTILSGREHSQQQKKEKIENYHSNQQGKYRNLFLSKISLLPLNQQQQPPATIDIPPTNNDSNNSPQEKLPLFQLFLQLRIILQPSNTTSSYK